MSGHSKWATIKHKKALLDQKRGKVFSQLVRQIQIAARDNPDPSTNPSLRVLVDKAKASNMPNDNIERAIKKGSGQEDGSVIEELTLEAYGPVGSAFLIEAITDNHNRTVAEMKHLVERNGGHMAEKGSVAWLFEKKTIFKISLSDWNEDLELALIDASLEDSQKTDDGVLLLFNPQFESQARQIFKDKGVTLISEELDWQAKNPIELSGGDLEKVENFNDLIDENDDTKAVYNNLG
ncbi:MAG: YebC/PmpR family DNA-binding transcriptional regulator [Candidatus Paceibacterota bacterium]|jgi:YebC/PmpR family DNA-binding regulatory protein